MDELEKERLKALGRQDGLHYRVLCLELGIAPEDEFLSDSGAAEAEFHKLVFTDDTPKNWGIRRKDIEETGLWYSTLKSIFYGMNNIAIPHVMLDSMNPAEIIAAYHGVNINKGDLPPSDFCDLMIKIHVSGKKLENFLYPVTESYLPKETKKQRLSSLDSEVRSRFVDSFYSPKLFSHTSSELNSFYDPNCDGYNRKVYVDRIWSRIKEMWVHRQSMHF